MDDGRSRGGGRFGDGVSRGRRPSEAERNNDMAASDWEGYRNRIDQEWRARRASAQESGSEPAAWLRAPSGGPGPGEFSVDSFADRLLGGPGAELYGGSGGLDSGRFAVVPSPGPDFSGMDPDAIPPLPMGGADDEEVPDQGSGLVRPYFRTKGRTRPSRDLAIEALVSTSERGRVLDRVRVAEHRSICDLCLDTRSVAEVAALLRLPLGVVRVLIGDVVGLGLVLVHSAGVSAGDRPNIEFMERVLSGLRRI